MSLKSSIMNLMPDALISHLEPIVYRFELLQSKIRWNLFGKKLSPYDIPIIINNYNHLDYLKRLIKSLTIRGYYNLYILDNNSTYPPLLEYYKETEAHVIFLGKNYGFRALWESGIVKKFWNSYYVYTDSDMELIDTCPANFMEYFIKIISKYNNCFKVGFGLKIDDLPDSYDHKNEVINHESIFWSKQIENDLYMAPIDTTFALYRPYTGTSANSKKMNIRTGGQYTIRHLPWYSDSSNPTEEEIYYTNSIIQSTHWSKMNKNSKIIANY